MKKSKFTEAEKQEAVERYVLHSEQLVAILKSIGISKSTFYVWLKEYRARQSKEDKPIVNIQSYKRLEAKVERLQGMIEILKTVPVTVSAPLKEKLYAVERLSGQYSVHMICEALDIPRGTYYTTFLETKTGIFPFCK